MLFRIVKTFAEAWLLAWAANRFLIEAKAGKQLELPLDDSRQAARP